MKYTIRHLEVFLAVARVQSISKAAQELCLSQSATSAALQEFESRYDIKLFDRVGKRLRLNGFGDDIRAKAEALMTQLNGFDRNLKQQEESGHLRVGASYFIGNYLAVRFLAEFMQEDPSVEVKLQVGSTPEIVAKVLNFEVDIGLIEAEIQQEELNIELWREDTMRFFCSPSHPFAKKAVITDEDLTSVSWVLREADSGHRLTFNRAMQGLLPDIHVVLELTHYEAIKNAVKAGLGISCMSEIAIADEVAQGSLVPIVVENRSITRSFYFITRKTAMNSTVVDRWVSLCRDFDHQF